MHLNDGKCVDGDPRCTGPTTRRNGWMCPECNQAMMDADDLKRDERDMRRVEGDLAMFSPRQP